MYDGWVLRISLQNLGARTCCDKLHGVHGVHGVWVACLMVFWDGEIYQRLQ